MQIKKHTQFSLISCLLFSLTGCGQTGSLYLPETKEQQAAKKQQTQQQQTKQKKSQDK